MRGQRNLWLESFALIVLVLLLPSPSTAKPAPSRETTESLRATSLRNYLSLQPDGMGLDVLDGPVLNQILLSLPKGMTSGVSVSFSQSPARLTVSLPAWKGKKELKVSGINTSFVSGLKLTPSKTGAKMVISLSSGRKLEYQTGLGAPKSGSDSMIISVAPAGKLRTTMAALPQGYRKPVLGQPSETRPSDTPTRAESNTADSAPPPQSGSLTAQVAQETGSGKSLKGTVTLHAIRMPVFSGGENALVIEADSQIAQAPELQALGNSVYALRFKNSRLSQNANMTSLFPSDSGTLGSVRASQQGNDALIKIYCAGENPLQLKTSGNRAVVGAENVVVSYSFK